MREEQTLAEIEDFIEGFNQPTIRGMWVNGVRVATWSSRDGWSGDTGRMRSGSLVKVPSPLVSALEARWVGAANSLLQ